MSLILTLGPIERTLAVLLAQKRQEFNRKQGVKNLKVGPQDAWTTELEGIGAELFYCQVNNLWPDMNISDRPIEDCLTRSGYGVDVKATKYENGNLVVATSKINKQAQLYALVVGKFPTYRLAGHATAEQVFRPENITDLGYGPCYAVPESKLAL